MDWAGVITLNSTALKPVIDTLFAMLGLATRLSPGVYRRVLRLLRPTESAVRRLIVIAAHGLVVKPVPARSKPAGPITGKGEKSRCSFPLFDTRKNFNRRQRKTKGPRVVPRIHFFGPDGHRVITFGPTPRPSAPQPSDGLMDAARIIRRLQALTSALNDLPRQAKRLARWRQKRATIYHLKLRYPMRPGYPPGYLRRKTREIDRILHECHYFARETMKLDTS